MHSPDGQLSTSRAAATRSDVNHPIAKRLGLRLLPPWVDEGFTTTGFRVRTALGPQPGYRRRRHAVNADGRDLTELAGRAGRHEADRRSLGRRRFSSQGDLPRNRLVEWNGHFRDDVGALSARPGARWRLRTRIAGSRLLRTGRAGPDGQRNFVTCHDGSP